MDETGKATEQKFNLSNFSSEMSLALRHWRSAHRLPLFRRRAFATRVEHDELGIPVRPTWSVHELLSSYPSPKLQPAQIQRLYELSALIPPEEGSVKYAEVKEELEEMIRLVEAVRLVDTSDVVLQGRREQEDADQVVLTPDDKSGQDLLTHSSRTKNGFYVVDADRRRG